MPSPTRHEKSARRFPLYRVAADAGQQTSITTSRRASNIEPGFVQVLADKTGMSAIAEGKGDLSDTFGPEDIFGYIYATLHAGDYRQKYAPLLSKDFARIPLPEDSKSFADLARLGHRLATTHLMEESDGAFPSFDLIGDNVIRHIRYAPPTDGQKGRVEINQSQHFEGVDSEVWGHKVGIYQPAERWLSERQGRTLSTEDIQHYRKMCRAIAGSQDIIERIDDCYSIVAPTAPPSF